MQATSLLLLAFSAFSTAAPLAQVHHAGRDLAASHPSPPPAHVLKPITLHGRSKEPTLVLLPSHGHDRLARRMLSVKIPKGKGKGKDKDSDSPKSPVDPAQAAKQAERAKLKAEKAAIKAEKKKKSDEAAAAAEAKKKTMTPEEQARADAELKAQKEADRKRNEEDKQPAPRFVIKDPEDYKNAWREFTKKSKGADNKGWVEIDDIAKAFQKCVKSDEFLFWTAAGNKAFEAAIPGYAETNNMMQIAKAAATKECQNAGLAGMGRPVLNLFVREYIQDRIMDEQKKKPAGKGLLGRPKPNPVQNEEMKRRISYDYYWAVMSAGYAKAASGKVVYVRPDNAIENPMSHWSRYEWPQLKVNSKVTEVHEVTFDVNDSVGIDTLRTMQPKVDRILDRS